MKILLNLITAFGIAALLFVCCTGEDSPFEVKVVDPDAMPIIGACIAGGIDWDAYSVLTDSMGIAVLPGHARNESAMITKDNFFPLYVQAIFPAQYTLEPTAHQLRLIGSASGTAIIFDETNLVTLDYSGSYHVYTYDDQSIAEVATASLPSTMKRFILRGDTLWYTTHADGIYVYSLSNQSQPQQLFHLAIDGYLQAFAIRDSILAVGHPFGGPLRIFSYSTDGQFEQLASISEFVTHEMTIRDNYVILAGGESSMPTVFDITDPAQPVLVYNNLETGAQTALILDTILVVVPWEQWYVPNYTYTYKLIKISSPANPWSAGIFRADALLYDIIDNECAVGGRYYGTAVLAGNITSGFATMALITAMHYPPYGGSRPPYFLIQGGLWILEPR